MIDDDECRSRGSLFVAIRIERQEEENPINGATTTTTTTSEQTMTDHLETLFNLLPKSIYKTMGPFGRVVTLPFMLILTPLLVLPDTVLPFSVVFLLPLWVVYLAMLPLFLFVICAEHGIHRVGQDVFGKDIRWVRKRNLEEKHRLQSLSSSSASASRMAMPWRQRRMHKY